MPDHGTALAAEVRFSRVQSARDVAFETQLHETLAKAYLRGQRACLSTAIPSRVPQGRLNLAQDASPGLDSKGRPVPQGRLEIGRDEILENVQPSLRD